MDFLVALLVFTSSLVISIIKKITIILPLLVGVIVFSLTAYHRGFDIKSILIMLVKGMKKSIILIPFFTLIGMLTSVWRASGTIPFLVYYGTSFINPDYFILIAFLLTCLVSFSIGTSFGTAGTIGVVLIVLARGGGVNVNAVAGAIISGAFFGDRCSPTSSSANLVAAITKTNLYDNVKRMLVTGFIPFTLAVLFYLFISLRNPINTVDNSLLIDLPNYYKLNIITILPALIIFILAVFKVNVKTSMIFSIIMGIVISVFLQGFPFAKVLKDMIFGFNLDGDSILANIISDGGIISMLNASIIILLASSYSGIFEETNMLKDIQNALEKLSDKIGVYLTTTITSIITSIFGCNQTLPVLLTYQLMHKIYEDNGFSNKDIAIDIENTVILIAVLIPWSIAVGVPLATLSVGPQSIPYAAYIYLVPLVNIIKLPFLKKKNINVS
ncbi:Na+/H+ antiporter NhaC family protein [Sedimentibacter sp. MB31-C6]|uniref:Na+/H+ antiporter NhaC family protein n=1 Tax=Sedimentibacter sp. MB31-C6 TaxID=3109366 RepID=UPI002DDD4483|nr:Na+/H+ antiporter NhaC family protein [Sedimentibacter sp. MB36-C1]WSI03998.1 Na+/H+ antiporter NhaC family protein [Sedimentibacter sp. MB36-C1]